MKDVSEYNLYKKLSFDNEIGGLVLAREALAELKKTNKPFLKKHPELEEDYNFHVKDNSVDLEYSIKPVENF